jgi:ureidoacrylate peracid hydrolase
MMFKGQEIYPALLAIDVQNCFVSKGSSYDTLGKDISCYRQMLPNIRRIVNASKLDRIPIFHMMAVKESSGVGLLTKTHKFLLRFRDERIDTMPICVRGTLDADIIDSIKSPDASSIIIKRRDSAFFGADLDIGLRKLIVDRIIICGVDTSICV